MPGAPCRGGRLTAVREGGCSCGAVRYRLASDPLFVHCCHCLNCQRQTGSAFVINLLIESDRVELLAGDPTLLRSIDLRARHGLTLVAIKRQVNGKEETLVSPNPDQTLLAGDIIALLGSNEQLAHIESIR